MALRFGSYYERYKLGDYVPVSVQIVNGSNVPADPTTVPSLTVYDSSGSPVTGATAVKVPPLDVGKTTGLFQYNLFLDSNFSAGSYCCYISYTAGAARSSIGMFEVVGGGDSQGPYIGITYYETPHAKHVVAMSEDGTVDLKRNPYV